MLAHCRSREGRAFILRQTLILLKGVPHDAARTVSATAALALLASAATAWAIPRAARLQPYRQ